MAIWFFAVWPMVFCCMAIQQKGLETKITLLKEKKENKEKKYSTITHNTTYKYKGKIQVQPLNQREQYKIVF